MVSIVFTFKFNFMKNLKKMKLQSYETLSNSEMKNVIGANLGSSYTCSTSSNYCSSSSGVCGSIGNMGVCVADYSHKENSYSIANCRCSR